MDAPSFRNAVKSQVSEVSDFPNKEKKVLPPAGVDGRSGVISVSGTRLALLVLALM